MPAYESDLAAVYAAEAELVTVAGTSVEAFYDGGYAETLNMAGVAPSLRCIASAVAAAAVGDAVTRGTAGYVVRGIEPIAPDELETRLILERA